MELEPLIIPANRDLADAYSLLDETYRTLSPTGDYYLYTGSTDEHEFVVTVFAGKESLDPEIALSSEIPCRPEVGLRLVRELHAFPDSASYPDQVDTGGFSSDISFDGVATDTDILALANSLADAALPASA